MRKWISLAFVVICLFLVVTVHVGPRFGPMEPNPNIPTFRETFGYDPKVTDNQSGNQSENPAYRSAYLHSGADCAYPGYPDGAEVVLLSAGHGQALSTVGLGGQDVSTTVISVQVEAGDKPLYVVATAGSAVVWRLSGATDRIRRLVLASTHDVTSTEWGRRIPMGETGVPRDNVTFLGDTGCVPVFGKPSSGGTTVAATLVKDGVGHAPTVIAGSDVVTRYAIPSGGLDVTRMGDSPRGRELEREHLWGLLSPNPLYGHPLDYDVMYSWPDGVVRIDPDDVIANVPVARYETLPGSAGLKQLVDKGALEHVGDNQFHILQPLRMPAELRGVHFTLMKGVVRPDGQYDGACVTDEETGRPISSDNRSAWPVC